ncbi:hypothetical protein ACS0TY_019945 [Phlomoides rotata]
MSGLYQPKEGEAIGLHEARSWINDLGFKRVIFEMDAKFVVDAVNGEDTPRTTYSDIVAGYRGVLKDNRGWSVVWVNREANVMAHRLARAARGYCSPHYWVECPVFVDCLPGIFCSCVL